MFGWEGKCDDGGLDGRVVVVGGGGNAVAGTGGRRTYICGCL
jgi:hypothetical protein